MSPARIYLALGSNLGERLSNLQAALAALPPGVQVEAQSPVYETPPWGPVEQGPFLNQVVRAATELSPLDLLAYLKHLEADLGRRPGVRYGPRKIDLDILFYDDLVFQQDELVIPHPHLHERAFVLVPLNDLAPTLCHPVLKKTVADLLKEVDTTGIVPYEDKPPRLPPDVRAALAAVPEAKERFHKLTPSHQREYLGWILSAKKNETRARRVGQMVQKLLDQRVKEKPR